MAILTDIINKGKEMVSSFMGGNKPEVVSTPDVDIQPKEEIKPVLGDKQFSLTEMQGNNKLGSAVKEFADQGGLNKADIQELKDTGTLSKSAQGAFLTSITPNKNPTPPPQTDEQKRIEEEKKIKEEQDKLKLEQQKIIDEKAANDDNFKTLKEGGLNVSYDANGIVYNTPEDKVKADTYNKYKGADVLSIKNALKNGEITDDVKSMLQKNNPDIINEALKQNNIEIYNSIIEKDVNKKEETVEQKINKKIQELLFADDNSATSFNNKASSLQSEVSDISVKIDNLNKTKSKTLEDLKRSHPGVPDSILMADASRINEELDDQIFSLTQQYNSKVSGLNTLIKGQETLSKSNADKIKMLTDYKSTLLSTSGFDEKLSKYYGYAVDNKGNVILDNNGQKIKVDDITGGQEINATFSQINGYASDKFGRPILDKDGNKINTSNEIQYKDAKQELDVQTVIDSLPLQLKNSEKEVVLRQKSIKQMLDNGMTVDEIKDRIIGYTIDKPDDFSKNLRSAIAKVELPLDKISEIAKRINSGDKIGAALIIENAGYRAAAKDSPNSYISETAVTNIYKKAERIEDLIGRLNNAATGNNKIEAFEGSIQDWLKQFKDSGSKVLASELSNLMMSSVSSYTGGIPSEAEKVFLENSIPNISDGATDIVNKTILLKKDALSRLNSVREQYGMPTIDKSYLFNKDLKANLYNGNQTTVMPTIYSKQDGTEVKYNNNSGTKQVDLSGVKGQVGAGWKTNNPVGITFSSMSPALQNALKKNGIAPSYTKDRPKEEGGSYAGYNTINDGIKAHRFLLGWADTSLRDRMNNWSANHTGAYVNDLVNIAKRDTGVDISSWLDKPIKNLTKDQQDIIMIAQTQKETPGMVNKLREEGIINGNSINEDKNPVDVTGKFDNIENPLAGEGEDVGLGIPVNNEADLTKMSDAEINLYNNIKSKWGLDDKSSYDIIKQSKDKGILDRYLTNNDEINKLAKEGNQIKADFQNGKITNQEYKEKVKVFNTKFTTLSNIRENQLEQIRSIGRQVRFEPKFQSMGENIPLVGKPLSNLLENTFKSFNKLSETTAKSAELGLSGEQSKLEALGQIGLGTAATGIGTYFDAVTGGLATTAAEEGIKLGVEELNKTELGKAGLQALGEGIDAYTEFANANPRIASNINALIDTAEILALKGTTKNIGNIIPKNKIKELNTIKNEAVKTFGDLGENYAEKTKILKDGLKGYNAKTFDELGNKISKQSEKYNNTIDNIISTQSKPLGEDDFKNMGELLSTSMNSLKGKFTQNELDKIQARITERLADFGDNVTDADLHKLKQQLNKSLASSFANDSFEKISKAGDEIVRELLKNTLDRRLGNEYKKINEEWSNLIQTEAIVNKQIGKTTGEKATGFAEEATSKIPYVGGFFKGGNTKEVTKRQQNLQSLLDIINKTNRIGKRNIVKGGVITSQPNIEFGNKEQENKNKINTQNVINDYLNN